MSQRETIGPVSLQEWKGVNQRLQNTLVPDGFFSDARGILFGYGQNAERVPGKVLAGRFASPVLGVFTFGDKAVIQTLNEVWITDIAELTQFELQYQPGVPAAPVLSAVLFNSITVTMPSALPVFTDSFTLQRSTDNISFATLQIGLAVDDEIIDTPIADSTTYYYRAVAVNTYTHTNGPSANETTPPSPSGNTRITEVGDTRITETGDTRITE